MSDRLAIGDEVFGMIRGLRTGSTAEVLVVDEYVVSKKPTSLTHIQAAGVPLAAITAFQCLERAGLPFPPTSDSPSKSVFLTGGPGGVGTFLIQIAKKMFNVGEVIVTASSGEKSDLCKALGADIVVDYKSIDFREALKGKKFDVCVDCSGETSKMIDMVKESGAISTIITNITSEMLQEWLNDLGPNPGITPFRPITGAINVIPHAALNFFTGAWWIKRRLPPHARFFSVITISSHHVLDKILPYLESGQIQVVIDQVFSLDNAFQAYFRSMSGKAVGKVIVEVISSS